MNRFFKSLTALILLPALALADNSITGPIVTMQTDGTQADGSANIVTNNEGPIRFYTNKTLRGYVDSNGTWVITGFAPTLPNNTYLKATNAAGTGTLNLLKADASDETILNSDSGDSIKLTPGEDANRLFTFNASSDTAHTLTFGDGGTTAAQALTIGASTADADDDSVLSLAGGGAKGLSRGGFIDIAGNEASSGGYVQINGGNATTGDIGVIFNNTGATFDIYNNATAKMWTWDNNNAQLFTQATSAITSASADAADSGVLYLSGGGGGTGVGSARGAFIGLAGNESGSTGAVSIIAGNVSGGNIDLATNGATSFSVARSSNSDLTFNKTNGYLRATTSDAADTGRLVITGGGNIAIPGDVTRGAKLILGGNEEGTIPGEGYLEGDGTVRIRSASQAVQLRAANVIIADAAGATTWTANASAGTLIGAGTGSIGWAVVDGADNTACTSQCTAPAVFGFNLAAGATAPVIVGPSDATADICLCAGAS